MSEVIDYSKRTFLSFLGILFAFILIMGWLLNDLTKKSLIKVELNHLMRISRTIEKEISEKAIQPKADLEELCDQFSKRTSYEIMMLDHEGGHLAGVNFSGEKNFRNRADVAQALENGSGTLMSTEEGSKDEIACSFLIKRPEGKEPIIVRVVQSKLMSQPFLEEYRESAWSRVGIVFLFIAIVVWVFTRSVSKPLIQLQALIKNLASNKESQAIDVHNYDQLRKVVRVLNDIFRVNREKLVSLIQERNNRESILAGMKEGLIALNKKGQISEINSSAEKLLDMKGIRKRGRYLGEILRSKELIELQDKLSQQGESFETEIAVNKGTGLERIFQVSGYVTEESVESNHSLMVFTDITRLRKLENMRQEFVANVSHELKTPLTSIRGYAETLRGMAEFSEEIPQKFLERVEQNADRLHNIIEDLMSLSRIEQSGISKDELEGLTIKFVFDRLKREFSQELLERTVFEISTKRDIVAHGPLLHQALFNLIDNSLKYSGEGKEVRVTAVDDDEENGVWFNVIDNGQGIAKEHLPHLTDRFYRADKARSREKGGSGLGLSIVKHIAESHGGRIEIDSVLGEGSEFRLFLPEVKLD